MPIYEYECVDPKKACEKCVNRFEIIHAKASEEPLTVCPSCGQSVKKVISWCRAAIVEASAEDQRVGKKISDYEKAGMWSHAAELADSHSEAIGDKGLKTRALENYKKAGYDTKTLDKHLKKDET